MPGTEYDGYAPIHHCTCGCGMVIGDGDWAHGRRSHVRLAATRRRLIDTLDALARDAATLTPVGP